MNKGSIKIAHLVKSKVSVDKMSNNPLKLNVNIEPEKPAKLYSIEIDCDKLNEEALIDL